MPVKETAITTYVGAGTAMFFGMTASELAALIGAGVAVMGFIANMWFQYLNYKLNKDRVQENESG